MTVINNLELPPSEKDMVNFLKPKEKIFICFVSSNDPETGKMWCSDCRDTEANILCHFNHPKQTKTLAMIEVGVKEEWRNPNNHFRKNWNISAIPTLVRYIRGPMENTPEIKIDRLIEKDLQDGAMIKRFRDYKSDWLY